MGASDLAPDVADILADIAVQNAVTGPGAAVLAQVWGGVAQVLPQITFPEAVALALDILAAAGQISAKDIRARLPMMAVRAASRLRAQSAAFDKARQVHVAAVHRPYAAFFAVEDYDLTHDRFDGTTSDTLRRAVFVMGDAVTVLPFDPIRRRVLLVQQFRAGPFARGDGQAWQYEPIAGRIDAGDTPESAARREAIEEAGLQLQDLHFVASYYPSPGAVSEYLYSFVALCDLPDDAGGLFGLAHEGEDIKAVVMDVTELQAWAQDGRISNGPLLLTTLWLGQNLDRFAP